MEKRSECEIVQDLLLGYVDDTLNAESKKLVEKHLSECASCKEKLKMIREDMKEKEENQKKEIDYLKKIRRRSRIKSILIAMGIILVIVLGIYISKFIKINRIENKSSQSLQANNIYIETRQMMGEGEVAITKKYIKDGKYKSVWEIYTDEGSKIYSTTYGSINSDEVITIDDNNKTVLIDKGEFAKMKNQENSIKFVPFVRDLSNSLFIQAGVAFVMSIDVDTYEIGREYYVIRNQFEQNQRWEIWIDKDTGLPLREINKGGSMTRFPGTDIVKKVSDNVQEYRYEFDVVKEEDVQVPDYSDYKIEYSDLDEINELLSNK